MPAGYSLARLVVRGVAGLGVVKVISDIVTTTAIRDTRMASLKSKIGVVVIGSIVGEVVTKHIDGRIDQFVAAWQEQKAELDAKVEAKIKEVTTPDES